MGYNYVYYAMFGMGVYGYFAMTRDSVTFNYYLAAVIILFVLAVETVILLVEHITKRQRSVR